MTTRTLALSIALCCATPLLAQQNQLRVEWSKNVTEYREQNGRRVTLVCPPQGQLVAVYGTDTYTDDTGVCSAAVHAGLITVDRGGVVTIVVGPGQDSYASSTRNGVASRSFGKWYGSFSFDRSAAEGRIDWGTQATGLSLAGRPLTLACPAGGENHSVWGTDVYTDDSSICTAAVHAGLITYAAGGRVTVQDAGDQPLFTASDRNGVRSREYTSMPNAFRFATATAVPTGTVAGIAPSGTTAATTTAATTTVATATATTATAATAPTSITSKAVPTGVTPISPVQSTVATGAVTGVRAPTTQLPTREGMVGASGPPAAPTGVRAEPLHYRGTVMVHWDTVPGATGYDILQKLPDGKYAGAMPLDRLNGYGPERTQGITMELAAIPLSFSVVARYGPGEASLPSAPASVTIPRWYGRYRVSILGFKVERETSDDQLETDGKRDEVYLRAAAVERGPDGQQIGSVVERQTLVHGDINTNEWRSATSPNRRIKAGSASVDGGLRTGDTFPSATPWQRSTSNSTNSFPLQVWEGELFQGQNTVQVAFNLWESDQRPGQSVPSYSAFSPEASALERAGPATKRLEPSLAGQVVAAAAAGVVLAPTLGPLLVLSSPALVPTIALGMAADKVMPRLPVLPKASTPLDKLSDEVGLTAASLAVSSTIENSITGLPNALALAATAFVNDIESNMSMSLNIKDRPLGVRKDEQGRLSAIPGTLTLNFENAESEALSGNGPAGKGAGVYEYRFMDTITEQGGNGIYVVYLQVERIQ